MKYKYQTSYVTFLQFIIVVLLGLLDNIINIISVCHSQSNQCISNIIPTIIYFILTAGWFGIILIFGYFTQSKRDRKLAGILICLELITLAVSGYINFPHAKGINNKITSLVDALFSLWVLFLAANIFISNKKRIVKTIPIPRPKKR